MSILRRVVFALFLINVLPCCSVMAQEPIIGDFTEDNIVNYKDLDIFIDLWMDSNCSSPNCVADFDGFPGVDMTDYAIFSTHWGEYRIVINEFLAWNTIYLDPDGGAGEYDDWIELYNPSPNTVALGGMYLTDDLDNLTKWQIPDGVTIGGNSFVVFWADEDLSQGDLHTNFQLERDGEAIALVDPNGEVIIDSIVFGAQEKDNSYGRYFDGENHWYSMYRPTPNSANNVGRSAEPKFSKPSSTFMDPFLLELRSEKPGAEFYYTLDGTRAKLSSPKYTSPISINQTTWVRAIAKEPNLSSSYEISKAYFALHSDVQNFTSNLPIVVIDTLDNDIDSEDKLFKPVLAGFIDTKKTGQASIRGYPDYAGYAAMHARGRSSFDYEKKQYRLEIRNHEDNSDKDVALLGLPSESDWILFGPWSDKTLMRNSLMYNWNQDTGRYGVRCRFVEVFMDRDMSGEGGDHIIEWDSGQYESDTDYWGVYVLMEKIKQGKNRIDVDNIRSWQNTEPEITGGYVLRKDWLPEDEDAYFLAGVYGDNIIYEDPDFLSLTSTQKSWVKSYFNGFENALSGPNFKNPTHANYYGNYIDIVSFLDHHILVELGKNVDGFVLSTYLFKERSGKIHMGPVWDFNGGLGGGDYVCDWDPIGWLYEASDYVCCMDECCTVDGEWPLDYGENYEWYVRLFEDPEFLLQYADRWFELREKTFTNTKMLQDVDDNVALLKSNNAVDRNYTRWPTLEWELWPNYLDNQLWFECDLGYPLTYDGYVQWMKDWIGIRADWMDSEIDASYGAEPPVIKVNGTPNNIGGQISNTDLISLTKTTGGTIWYTTDGNDPREHGGAVYASATAYSSAFTLDKSAEIKARIKDGSSWSALNRATFAVGPVKENLRITELMYHPQDTNDPNDPNGEFIELKNIGGEPINLNLVRFSDGVDFTFGDYVLSPGAYTVVVPNINTFEAKYGTGISVAGEYGGRLNNGGEEIVIRDANNAAVLEFDYEDDWYPITDGHGFSLTVFNEMNPDPNSWDSKTNWRPSADVNGSPGADDGGPAHNPDAVVINEVLAHSHGGAPDWIELYNTTGSSINLSGWFLSDDRDNLKKYEIQPGTSIPDGGYLVFDQLSHFGNEGNPGCSEAFALSENGETVYLTSGSGGELTGYSEEEKFGASETWITFGRHVTTTGRIDFPSMYSSTQGLVNSAPKVGPILITEIMYNPEDDGDAEYVELYNNTGTTIQLYDIEGNPWKFTDGGAIDYLFSDDANIPGYSYALLVKDKADFDFEGYPAVPSGVQIFEWGDGKLANGGEEIMLGKPGDLDASSIRQYIVVDKVKYDDEPPWPVEADGLADTLNRVSFNHYGNDPCNWQIGEPSPGDAYIPAISWTVLTYDDFESGWGNYSDGGSDCDLYTGGTYAHQGNNAADIQDDSGTSSSFYHTNGINVDAPGYTQIKIEFWFYAVSMDNSNEDFWVQYYDGSSWHTVADYNYSIDFNNLQFYNKEVNINESSYTFPSNMKIRFMCDASGEADDVYIDEISVSAK